jgi:hypothetical protein
MFRFLLILMVTTTVLPAWQWPTDRLETLQSRSLISPGTGFGGSGYNGVGNSGAGPGDVGPADLFVYAFKAAEGAEIPLLAPITGEVVFSGPGFRPFPTSRAVILPGMPSLVIQNSEDFRITLWAEGVVPPSGHGGGTSTVAKGMPLGDVNSLLFSVYDLRQGGYINPRILLPYDTRLPEETLPPVRFMQQGRPVEASSLEAGSVRLVIPAEEFSAARLPRSIHLLRDGVLEGHREFVRSDDVMEHLDREGNFRIADVSVAVGSGVFILEGHRFDGSVMRRRVSFTVLPEADPPDEIGPSGQ